MKSAAFLALIGLLAGAANAQAEEDFKPIFNGTDLTGWDGDLRFWSVEDGAIAGRTTPETPIDSNTFLVWTNGVVDNFELRFSYRIIPNPDTGYGNSGVQYRSRVVDPQKWILAGYQADLEAGPNWTGAFLEERGRGILAQRGQVAVVKPEKNDPEKHRIEILGSVGDPVELQNLVRPGDWNDHIVLARGHHHINIINGRVMTVLIDDHPARHTASGVLGLQLQAGEPMHVEFKNMRLKRLEQGE
jgi:hypothetical protein